jgi:hypothetical protein
MKTDREAVVRALPRWYSPWGHLAATVGIGALAIAIAAVHLTGLRVIELLTVPLVFILANYAEWRVHKDILHKRRPPLQELFDRHTPEHHQLYQEHSMEMRDIREFKLVLIPAVGVLGAIVATTPFAFLAGRFITENTGYLVMLTAAAYMVGYEVSHLIYHLPERLWISRWSSVRILRTHHAKHHRTSIMQTRNFNVTIPLFDWIMGTKA